jgi:hypothetical protein
LIADVVAFARSPVNAEFVKLFESRLLSLQVNSKMWETLSNQKFWDVLLDAETVESLENGKYWKFVVQSIIKRYPLRERVKNAFAKLRSGNGLVADANNRLFKKSKLFSKGKPEPEPSEVKESDFRVQTVVFFFNFLYKIMEPLLNGFSSRM